MKARSMGIFVLGIVLLTSFGSARSDAQTNRARTPQTRTETLLKEIKANYLPFQGPGTYVVPFKGKHLPEIDVILIDTGDVVVILADVAAGKEIDLTPAMMVKLLEFNLQADYVKVGVSDLRSIRVQTEQKLVGLKGKILGELLDQVVASTDEVAGILAPVRKPSGIDK